MRRIQIYSLAVMLSISLILVFAVFPIDVANASPPGPEPDGLFYRWKCSNCIYETWQCPSHWMKICERWLCERDVSGVECIYVGPTEAYCCTP